MEQELKNLIKVWFYALISLCYCYYITSRASKGVLRLLYVLPICILFLVLPLFLSSVHFCGISVLFLSWIANFNLLLYSFEQGPLCPLPPNLSSFVCFTCFPIKIRQNPSQDTITSLRRGKNVPVPVPKWVLGVKVLLFGVLLHVYEYIDGLPQFFVLVLYCLHIYLEAELVLVFVGAAVSTFLGCDIEPVFNEPYLATSLQDFWSCRWNLMVSSVLRSTIHVPVQRLFKRSLGPKGDALAGVLASFFVSGLMHELLYYYLTRLTPTWEVTCFFALHGVATATELAVKRTLRSRPMHRAVSGFAVLAFVNATGVWLFLPQLLRNNVHKKVISECLFVIELVKRNLFISSYS